MKNLLKVFLGIVFLSSVIFAQTAELNTPVNFKKAYENSTRSLDGKPGSNYWQNKSEYNIQAVLNPAERMLSGSETITYYNNSPDTLKQIVIRLYPDIYRKGNLRDFEIDPAAINEGMDIKKIMVAGKEMSTSGKDAPQRLSTNLFIKLDKQVSPKSKIDMNFEWSFSIPNKSQIRMGAYDSTSFFVAYWYPQVAVYDDIDGWDVQNYTGRTEMYNDFNDYNIELTVPNGFLLWSTGVLQNPEEVYPKNILEKYNKAHGSDEIVNIVTNKDYDNGSVTTDKHILTYKIKAEYVPDLAFATSDHYLWDASDLVVDKSTGRRSFISAAYDRSTNDFSTVADVARKSIDFFSNEMPGVPYPYPSMTVFNGQGGMEFPMMCNNSAVKELQGTVHLTSHEICHTYFPFYMGINERKYAWMDEGWATMLPFDFQEKNAPGYDPRTRNAKSYSEFAGYDSDRPLMAPSYDLRDPAYRTASYRRPGAAYDFLHKFLGDNLFKKALREYIKRWNGKHPVPYDFFYTFNNVIGSDLSWYWKPWFFEQKYPDLSLAVKNNSRSSVSFSVKNIGGLPLTVIVKAYYKDGTNEVIFNQNADIWKSGKTGIQHTINSQKKVIKLELGTTQIPDINTKDNVVYFEQ